MTHENFGSYWGLDHIVPVEIFDIYNEEEAKICFSYLNIMPMINEDNRLKGASIHFSLDKINSLMLKYKDEKSVYILTQLKSKCINEINERYTKYLI